MFKAAFFRIKKQIIHLSGGVSRSLCNSAFAKLRVTNCDTLQLSQPTNFTLKFSMQENEDFFIDYKGNRIKVSPVLDEANIHFIIHFQKPVIIEEGMVNEEWVWFEAGKGETALAAEIGEIIEDMGI